MNEMKGRWERQLIFFIYISISYSFFQYEFRNGEEFLFRLFWICPSKIEFSKLSVLSF